MEIDKKTLDKALESDDEALKKQILMIAQAMGIDERKASGFLSDMPKIRKKAESISQRDIERLTSSIDSAKLEEIKRAAEIAMKKNEGEK